MENGRQIRTQLAERRLKLDSSSLDYEIAPTGPDPAPPCAVCQQIQPGARLACGTGSESWHRISAVISAQFDSEVLSTAYDSRGPSTTSRRQGNSALEGYMGVCGTVRFHRMIRRKSVVSCAQTSISVEELHVSVNP